MTKHCNAATLTYKIKIYNHEPLSLEDTVLTYIYIYSKIASCAFTTGQREYKIVLDSRKFKPEITMVSDCCALESLHNFRSLFTPFTTTEFDA